MLMICLSIEYFFKLYKRGTNSWKPILLKSLKGLYLKSINKIDNTID